MQRVLKLSKKDTPITITSYEPINNQLNANMVIEAPVGKVIDFRLDIINLFDWFLGVGSILLGFSMFLYNKYNLLAQSVNISLWTNTLQISLIAGGLGILLTDILDKNVDKNWQKFFQGILVLAYSAITVISFYFVDGGGVILFGTFTVVMIIKLIFNLVWIESFLTLVFLHSLAVPLTLIANPNLVELPASISSLLTFSAFSLWIWTFFNILLGFLLWQSHKKNWKLFWPLIILYGSAYIFFSLELASELAWSKTFFLLLLGLTCITFPIWETALYFRHQGRKLVSGFFSVLLFVFIVIISVIWVMEQNIKEYAVNELNNKAVIGKILLESMLSKAEATLTDSSLNPLVIEAVREGKEEKGVEVLKLIFNKDNDIRRLLLLNNKGDLIGLYPHIKTTIENFAFRDYFIEAKKTKKIFYSDIYESKTEPKLTASTISIPILAEGQVIGVMAMGLDLNSIGNKLQTVANPENQEYFLVMDKQGKRVIHPNSNLIGTQVDSTNIVFQFEGKNEGLGEGYNHKEIRTERMDCSNSCACITSFRTDQHCLQNAFFFYGFHDCCYWNFYVSYTKVYENLTNFTSI